ncbi:acid sphingomyelinase-like phosphodiesterase 3a [Stegodyphus dumicola]|uniref:acid sphingomyelinase-like phosphodiesterase 3a n=1 Tax=Stegodyphus dumicola TaxID=202533 RepID=UPI0015B1CA89|nr:acid sphingomyelinase-like phosphodiesterase 3a [Stegodyphus dumicola]
MSLPVNPSIRLLQYYQNNGILKDFNQFYLNLTKANDLNKTAKGQNNLYELLYSFAKFYGVQDLSTESLVKVYTRLKTDQNLYTSFFNFLTAGKESVTCDNYCKIAQLCSIACTSSEQYTFCMKNSDGKEKFPCYGNFDLSFKVIFMYAAVIIIPIGIFVGFFFYCHSRWALRKEPLYEPLMNIQ